MAFNLHNTTQTELKSKISQHYYANEASCVENLLQLLNISADNEAAATDMATKLITRVRKSRIKGHGVDALMQEFKLSTTEGIALMCVAESLLRIPDKRNRDQLIQDKITQGHWSRHMKGSNPFVNAASFGLLVTGKLLKPRRSSTFTRAVFKALSKGGEPLIRKAMAVVVQILGKQFVMSEDINSALKQSVAKEKMGYRFSYDMLGEAAVNADDASKYMQRYVEAMHAIGKFSGKRSIHDSPGISVKLSAIHPRYERAKVERVIHELYPRLKELCLLAKHYQIGIFIDAEEAKRLEISIQLFEKLLQDPALDDFSGLGFVVQAYQRRAPYVIDYIANVAQNRTAKIMVRLVKGAYWDSEIKQAQIDGVPDYPVFTRKFYTDLSYLACSQQLFTYQDCIYPLFATHNAYTLSQVYQMGHGKEYEFQCLFGMGETLYDNIVGKANSNIPCRVYAPVGSYQTLLPYLIRRLLENGANSSFVHQLIDKSIPIGSLIVNPAEIAKRAALKSNPHFQMPAFIYPQNRVNSKGFNLHDEVVLATLEQELNHFNQHEYLAAPLLANANITERELNAVFNPADRSDKVGHVIKANLEDVELAIKNADLAFTSWSNTHPQARAQIVLKMADKMEEHYYQLLNILIREAGKTLANAVSEVREAVDFCRYYATQVI